MRTARGAAQPGPEAASQGVAGPFLTRPRLESQRRGFGRVGRLALVLTIVACSRVPEPPPFPELARFADDAGVQELVAERIAACAARPREAERWRLLALALEANERVEEAIPFYFHALALDPKNARTEYRLAAAFESASRLEEAARHFARAAQLSPREALPERRRGALLLALGDLGGASEAYEQARRLGDGLPSVVGLAEVELALGKPEAALALLRPHTHETAKSPALAATFAAALRASGESERAATLASAPGERGGWPDPWSEELLASRANLAGGLDLAARAIAEGRAGAAVVRLEALRARYGERGPILALLGGAYLAANRLDEAEKTLAQAREVGPEHYALALNTAAVEHLRGRTENALGWARRAADLQPDSAKAAELIGTLLAESGQLEAAAEQLVRAGQLAPGKLEILLRTGQVEARLDRWSAAARTYRAARRIAPGRADLALAEAQCAAKAGDRAAAELALADARRLGARQEDLERLANLLRELAQ